MARSMYANALSGLTRRLWLTSLILPLNMAMGQQPLGSQPVSSTTKKSVRGFKCFGLAYPQLHGALRFDEAVQKHYLVFGDGQRILWDDGLEKTHQEKLDSPDIEDTISQEYPGLSTLAAPNPLVDPGRFRHMGLLKALYGADAKSVARNLETVHWLPGLTEKKLKFNGRHGAAEALRAVSRDLLSLGKQFHKYIRVTAGTFNWRYIKGTDRLSAHAFGIALDINVQFTDYWRWARRADGIFNYRNRIPEKIVHIFERHGFVWGGRWWHFDTMHFEYRPEFFQGQCRTAIR